MSIIITDVKFIDQTNKSHHVIQNFNISNSAEFPNNDKKDLRIGRHIKKPKIKGVSKAWVDCHMFVSYFQVALHKFLTTQQLTRHQSDMNVQLTCHQCDMQVQLTRHQCHMHMQLTHYQSHVQLTVINLPCRCSSHRFRIDAYITLTPD